jgi:ribonuclease PH
MVDLCYKEDSTAQVDSNIVLTSSGKIIEFQTTAEGLPFNKEQMDEIFNIAKISIDKIITMY